MEGIQLALHQLHWTRHGIEIALNSPLTDTTCRFKNSQIKTNKQTNHNKQKKQTNKWHCGAGCIITHHRGHHWHSGLMLLRRSAGRKAADRSGCPPYPRGPRPCWRYRFAYLDCDGGCGWGRCRRSAGARCRPPSQSHRLGSGRLNPLRRKKPRIKVKLHRHTAKFCKAVLKSTKKTVPRNVTWGRELR